MSSSLFLLVLFAALLHAAWNIVVKGGDKPLFDTALVAIGAFCSALPVTFFLPLPPLSALPWLFLSSLIHTAYYYKLAQSYERTDLSFSYTLMRGLAPVLTGLVLVMAGVPLQVSALVGILILCTGVLCLGFEHRRAEIGKKQLFLDLLYPFQTAFIITSYTIVDGFGARLSGYGFSYACWLFLIQMFPVNLILLIRKRDEYLSYARIRLRFGLLGGLGSFLSYAIAIYAMTNAPIAVVAALRESSVIFGMLLAVCILGERMTLLRTLSVLFVFTGGLIIRLF